MRFVKWYNVYDGRLVAVCDDDLALETLWNIISDPENFDDGPCEEINESEYDNIFDTCETTLSGGWNQCRIYEYREA